jgi:RNA polymerase sigma-70 factor (ECF subfamily)
MRATADALVARPLSSRESSALAPCTAEFDFALIDAISNGDRRAIVLLYRRHSTKVYRFAFRLVGDEGVAEELVSEVFVQVWRNASTFEGRSKVSTWMLAIARQRALRAMRRRSPQLTETGVCEMVEDESDGPEVTLYKREVGSILSDVLKTLSLAHRTIIDLVYYRGMSCDEVARIADIPVNTAKTRMFYARNQLVKALARAGYGPELLQN